MAPSTRVNRMNPGVLRQVGTPADEMFERDAKVWLQPRLSHLHLFGAETGMAL